jgi:hypothetical protein
MNLGWFRFEVDPTQTLARLHLENRIHISGWLWAAWRKVEDSAVAADTVGRMVTTARHGGQVGTVLDGGSLSQEMGQERKMGGGGLG